MIGLHRQIQASMIASFDAMSDAVVMSRPTTRQESKAAFLSVYRARMAWIFGIVGAAASVAYCILFDPSRHPAHMAWSTLDVEVLAIYGSAGFAAGCVLGFAISRIGHHDL